MPSSIVAVAEFAVPMPVTMPSTPVLGVVVQVMVMRERQARVELLALAPELELPGGVAGVRADFEHRDHDDLHFDRLCGRRTVVSAARRTRRLAAAATSAAAASERLPCRRFFAHQNLKLADRM